MALILLQFVEGVGQVPILRRVIRQVEASPLAEQNMLGSDGRLAGVAQSPLTLRDNRIVFWWDLDLLSI